MFFVQKVLQLLLFFLFTIYHSNAQISEQLNFVDYQLEVTFQTGSKLVSAHVKVWFNDTIHFHQKWPIDAEYLNKDGSHYSHADSITNFKLIQDKEKSFTELDLTTYCIPSNKANNIFVVDYMINEGKPYYYKRNSFKNYLNDIILIEDTSKIILGETCKLAIGTYTNYYDSSSEQISIWYNRDIKAPFGPDYFIKNIPGLIMEIEKKEEHYLAVRLEKPAKQKGNFNLDVAAKNFHTKEEYIQEYEKFRSRNQQLIDKQKKENEKKKINL